MNNSIVMNNSHIDTLANLTKALADAQSAFVERNETAQIIFTSIAAGTHALLLGKPGTTKSALISNAAKMTGLAFRKVLMNPDITRDEIVGAVDPKAFAAGKWDRVWSALAVADLAFVDEVGKATGANLNILLNLMEEREVVTGGNSKSVPLKSLFGASNEIFSGTSPAVWDRFLARTIVQPVSNDNFIDMLQADIDHMGSYPVDPIALAELRTIAKQMARNAPRQVYDVALALKIGLTSQSSAYVSDRRWRQIIELAAGNALLNGRDTLESADLNVARWCVWDVPRSGDIAAEIANIDTYVLSVTDTAQRELMEFERKVTDLRARFDQLCPNGTREPNTDDDLIRINFLADKVFDEIKDKKGRKWAELRSQLELLKGVIRTVF